MYETYLGGMSWVMLSTRTHSAAVTLPDTCTISGLLSAQLPGVLVESQRLVVENMLARLRTGHGSPLDRLLHQRMCPASAEADLSNRLAFGVSLILSEKEALTLQLDFDTAQTLGPDWLNMALQPKQLQGEVSFRYRAWTLHDYAQNRALIDQRLSERPASQIYPLRPQAALI